MGIRFVPNYDTYLSLLAADKQQTNNLLTQASSGQRLSAPSDDPTAAAELIETQTQLAQNDQFTRSVQGLQSVLQTADSALSTVINNLTQAISLGTEGANGGLSANNRQSLASEVDSLKQQVLSAANASYQGSYVFGGTATGSAPYVADANSPSGVSYVGNNNTNQVGVSPGQLLTVNKPGSAVFGAGGGGQDVFQALTDLSTALNTNGDVASATAEVQQAFSNVNLQRTFYGNTLSNLNADLTNLSQQNLVLTQQQSSLDAANLPQIATELAQAQTTLSAAYAVFGRISQNSLFDYLK